ncbi:unnamed protein product [Lupinus luteus]|uniref:Uncharacterized protein n=1 Tax=Lupinus luteus TaxID=3873 RepID=A0AAV1Y629_LUPLU
MCDEAVPPPEGANSKSSICKSVLDPGSGASQSSSLADAAVEAATFAQQFDTVRLGSKRRKSSIDCGSTKFFLNPKNQHKTIGCPSLDLALTNIDGTR